MTHELVEGVEVPTRTIGAFESFGHFADGRHGCIGDPIGPALIEGCGFTIFRHVRAVPRCGRNIPHAQVLSQVTGHTLISGSRVGLVPSTPRGHLTFHRGSPGIASLPSESR